VFTNAGKIGGFAISTNELKTTTNVTTDFTVPNVLITANGTSSYAQVANRRGND
jgi:hypothetical protein